MTESSGAGSFLNIEGPAESSMSGTVPGTGTIEHSRIGTTTTVGSFEIPSTGSEIVLAPPMSLELRTENVESAPQRNWAHMRFAGSKYAQQVLDGHPDPESPEQAMVFGEAVKLLDEERESAGRHI